MRNNNGLTNLLHRKSVCKVTVTGLLLIVTSLSGCNASSNAQQGSHKWSGEWEFKDPNGSNNSIRLILTPEGKAYVMPPKGSNPLGDVAYEVPLDRVSDNTKVPDGIKVVSLKDSLKGQATKARNSEGRNIVGSMNRGQQAYMLENDKFATNIKDLGIGIKPESENYVFKTVPQSANKGVMNVAQAKKKELSSYIGLVYITKSGSTSNETTTVARLCETTATLSSLPALPKPPATSSDKIECPNGFKSIR